MTETRQNSMISNDSRDSLKSADFSNVLTQSDIMVDGN